MKRAWVRACRGALAVGGIAAATVGGRFLKDATLYSTAWAWAMIYVVFEFVTYRFTRHAATQTEWPQDHAMTEKSAEVGLQVRRGLHWQWGGEDGCIGQGIVVKVKGSRATVRWQDDTIIRVYSHYRLGPRNFDLCHAAPPSVDQHVQTEMTKSVLVRKVSFTDYPDPEPCGADTPEWEDIASSRSDMLVRRGE